MVFTLVSAVQERLTDMVEAMESARVEEVERRAQEVHAIEQASLHGLPHTHTHTHTLYIFAFTVTNMFILYRDSNVSFSMKLLFCGILLCSGSI